MVSKMENGLGKVWDCLLILVLAAVVIGLLYYTTAAKEPDEEGFLIRAEQMESGELRSEELQSVQTWNGVTGYGICICDRLSERRPDCRSDIAGCDTGRYSGN